MKHGHASRGGLRAWSLWLALLPPIGAAAGGPAPAADRIDQEWRDRFVVRYFGEILRDRSKAQKESWIALHALHGSPDTKARLQAASRYLLAMEYDTGRCEVIDEYMALAYANQDELPKELFDVAVTAIISPSSKPCASSMPIDRLTRLAEQLGDPARMFFVKEAQQPALTYANRFNESIELYASELSLAITDAQAAYAMLWLAQAELLANPAHNRAREWLERAQHKVSAEDFPALQASVSALRSRVELNAGDTAAALEHIRAAVPALRQGILGSRDSAFYLISFARTVNRAGKPHEARSLLGASQKFETQSREVLGYRSRTALEILGKVGTAEAYAQGLREIQNINWLLGQTEAFGPQRVKTFKQGVAAFLERFGKYEAALSALKEANVAAEQFQQVSNDTARVELQEKLNAAAKDKENAQLKAEAELQAERQRGWVVAFGVALLGGGLAAVALGLAVRRGRRLASVSAELAQRNGELEQRSASRIRLLAAACHDLRQPAHALGMLAELGGDARRDPSRFGAWLQSVRRSTASLSEMLDALMDLGRLDSGQYTPRAGRVSLTELVQDVALHFGALARRKGLTLALPPAEGEVVSDPQLLRRIVFNLVANAIRYTDTGAVHLGLQCADGTVTLTVQDTGPGIPPDKLDDVFRDYVQLNPGRATEGLGIGLSIVRRAADLLGHPLSLRSPPGQGTVVTLQLPLAAERAGPANEQAAPAAAAPESGLIGLLEDDADVREATAALLRSRGYRVHAAAHASSLAEQLGPSRPQLSLVISDLHLGSFNGFDEVAQVRQDLQAPALPALLVTADMDAAVAIQAAQTQVYVAHKPLAPDRLAQIVHELLRPARQAEPRLVGHGLG